MDKDEISKIWKAIGGLKTKVFKNNFSANEIFNKRVTFNSRINLKGLTSDPVDGELNDLCVVNGVLKICTTASTTAAVYTAV